MTHASWQQEQFSIAYVRAVASVAGYGTNPRDIDVDGVDLSIHAYGGGGAVRSPKLDIQVKSETSGKPSKFPWSHALKVENHERLRHEDYQVPRVLVVVAMPKDVADWLDHTPAQLVLRHCAYWVSVRGAPATTNSSTISVRLPRNQTFSPAELDRLMKLIGEGKLP